MPLVAIAERERDVSIVEATQINMMIDVWITPAWAVMNGSLRNNMTPKMF